MLSVYVRKGYVFHLENMWKMYMYVEYTMCMHIDTMEDNK